MQPQFQTLPEHKKFNQNGLLTMDQGSPYSINMNVFLPSVPYMRSGPCRLTRSNVTPQIKPESLHTLGYPGCPNAVPAALQPPHEYTHHFNPANGAAPIIKQETLDFQDIPLIQLLNSDIDPVPPGPHSFSQPQNNLCSPMSAYSSAHPSSTHISGRVMCGMNSSGSISAGHYLQPHQQSNAIYLPPSPPNSEPSSPDRRKALLQKQQLPPPSYAASMASKLAGPALGPGASVPVQMQAVPARHNRRSNPDLEKRRIHHCTIPGEPPKSCQTSI